MPRVLAMLLALATLQLAPARAAAKDFDVARQWSFPARAEDLLAAILAYGDACDHGCRYRAPHVKQALVLPYQKRPDSFYVWTFVEDVQNTTFFTHITVQRDGDKIRVTLRLVGPKRAAELTKASGKPHDPNFDDSLAQYELEEQTEGGAFKQTRVRFTNKLQISGLAATFGAGTVRDRLDEDARATYTILHSVRPRPAAPNKPADAAP